ncbi:MAG: hypothetical protein Q8Q39_04485 [bacterium]|nr:hypothetical protein [bacterium]
MKNVYSVKNLFPTFYRAYKYIRSHARGAARHSGVAGGIKPLIALLLVVAILGADISLGIIAQKNPFAPKKANAQVGVILNTTIGDLARILTENVVHVGVKKIVQRISRIFLESLTNWVRSGFKGKPQFIERPDQFFRNLVRDGQLNHQLNLLATKLCYPLGRAGLGISISTPDVPGYPQLKCTARNQNLQGFFDDFSNGGWQTWGDIIQPQNNVYGITSLAVNAEGVQVANKTSQGSLEYVASQGFLGIKQCAVTAIFASALAGEEFENKSCAEYKNVTPGSVVSEKLKQHLTQEKDQWVETETIAQLLAAFIDTALNKFVGTKFMCLSCARGTTAGGGTVIRARSG